MKRYGVCALCSKHGELSFEHVPPESSFNDNPIFIKKHQHLFDKSSFLYGKRIRSNRGSGDYTLCISCNNKTGGWYGKDFSVFTHQGMKIINQKENHDNGIVRGTYEIKPLNVIKQILTMFMSIDHSGELRGQKDLVDFIQNKDKQHLPSRFKIYLFSTLSPIKRMMGYAICGRPGEDVKQWSEINFDPFGYFLTIDSAPPISGMTDITMFGSVPYDVEIKLIISTLYLTIDSPIIGRYGNVIH